MRSASLLVAVALSMYAAPSFATDLWVAPTGRSGNAGTSAAPLDTIVTALQRARPGDRVMVRAGTYRGGGWISAQGTQARPITVLSADGPRRAVINGGSESLRIGDEASYLVFDGLEIRGADNNVVHIDGGAHHIWLRNVFAHDAGQDGDVVKVNQSSSIYIESSEIARPGRRDSSENPYQECIDFVDVDDIVVRDSWIHDGGGSLMYAKGGSRGVVFERNLISGQRSGAADPMVGLGGVTDSDILGGERFEAYDLIFRNNILLGGAAGGVAVYDASDASIANNLFVNVAGSAIVQFRPGSGPAARSENVRAVNNIFLDTRGRMPDPFRRSGGHGVNAFTTSHNLFWNNGSRVPDASLINLASQPGHLVADPMIAVADEADRATLVSTMTPAENSPAFDSGIAVSASPFFVVDDIRGVNRGAHNDRGPWAIGVEAPTAPTPDGDAGAPTNPTPSQDAEAPTRADAGTPTVTDGGAPAADDPPPADDAPADGALGLGDDRGLRGGVSCAASPRASSGGYAGALSSLLALGLAFARRGRRAPGRAAKRSTSSS